MKVRHIFLTLFTIVSVFGVNIFFVRADDNVGGTKEDLKVLNEEISARKDKIKQLEETIGKYKAVIATKETEAVSLKNQLNILDNRIAQIEADIELSKEKIKETQLEIDALNISIGEKQKTIAKQKLIIIKMVQNIYSSDQKNYLEVMLTYKDFGEFYSELRSTESVYIDLGRSVKSLRVAMEELQSKQNQVVAKQKVYKDLQRDLEGKKGDLEQQETVKQTLLSETRMSEARYQVLLSSLKQQYQVIENEQRSFEDKLRKKLEEQNKIPLNGSVLMSWPVPSHIINAEFHDSTYPFKKVFEHSGVDIKASYGTVVKAAAPGYVARARRCTTASCYAYVLIVHNGNISTVYGHLSSIDVAEDQFVNRGDEIGNSGGTPGTVGAGPFVTGPHLHFEVRQNGIPVDPMGFLIQ